MKILVSDFDGTLLDKNFEENIKFIQEFVRDGNIFIIATGRNITSLKKVICAYDIPFSYLINNDGGIIVDRNYMEVKRLDLDEGLCEELHALLEESKMFSSVFFDTGYTYQKDLTKYHNRVIGKIINRECARDFLEILRSKYSDKIYAYLSNNWINVTSGKNNKVTAVEWLIKENNWKKEDVYTVGDDENDVEMLLTYRGYLVGKKISCLSIKNIMQFKDIKEVL